MLVCRPFSAATKVPMEVWALCVSLPIVKVVGGLAAVGLTKFSVTPLMAPLTWLPALVAAKPLTEKFASWAACVCARLLRPFAGSYWSTASPPSPPDCVTLIALAAPVAVPDNTRRAPAEGGGGLALTPGVVGGLLMAGAIPFRGFVVVAVGVGRGTAPSADVRWAGALGDGGSPR